MEKYVSKSKRDDQRSRRQFGVMSWEVTADTPHEFKAGLCTNPRHSSVDGSNTAEGEQVSGGLMMLAVFQDLALVMSCRPC